MIDILKRIWAGPWSVKISFLFLAFVVLCVLLVDPGRVIFFALLFGAVIRIVDWLSDDE